jgi:hypothetical protein
MADTDHDPPGSDATRGTDAMTRSPCVEPGGTSLGLEVTPHASGSGDPKADKDHRDFLDYLAELREGKGESVRALDTHTLTLASGTLALSIAVLQLTSRPIVEHALLRLTWTILSCSIVSTVLSLGLSACSYWYLTAAVRASYAAGRDWRRHRARILRYVTRGTTLLGPMLFCAGLVLLAQFALRELSRSPEDAHGTHTEQAVHSPPDSPQTPGGEAAATAGTRPPGGPRPGEVGRRP